MVNSKLVHLHRRSTQQKWEHEYGKGEARKCPRATLRVRAPAACHPNTNSRRLWQTTPRRKRPRGSWWRWHGPAFGADGRCTQSRKACGRSGRAKSPRLICQLWSGRPQDIAAATPLSRSLHGQQSAAAPPQPARALKLTDLSPRSTHSSMGTSKTHVGRVWWTGMNVLIHKRSSPRDFVGLEVHEHQFDRSSWLLLGSTCVPPPPGEPGMRLQIPSETQSAFKDHLFSREISRNMEGTEQIDRQKKSPHRKIFASNRKPRGSRRKKRVREGGPPR